MTDQTDALVAGIAAAMRTANTPDAWMATAQLVPFDHFARAVAGYLGHTEYQRPSPGLWLVVIDHSDGDASYRGPFDDVVKAAEFADWATREIDPAHVRSMCTAGDERLRATLDAATGRAAASRVEGGRDGAS